MPSACTRSVACLRRPRRVHVRSSRVTVDIATLETERLVLHPPSASCADVYDAFYTDARASRQYGGPLTSGQAWSRLASDLGAWHLQGFGVWVIERKDSGDLVGIARHVRGVGLTVRRKFSRVRSTSSSRRRAAGTRSRFTPSRYWPRLVGATPAKVRKSTMSNCSGLLRVGHVGRQRRAWR
jgi:hypothetical protein